MIRPQTKTYRGLPVPPGQYNNQKTYDDEEFAANDFLVGIVQDMDARNIPPNALQEALNMEYVKGRLFRRNGLANYSFAGRPDENPIIGIFAYTSPTHGITLLRFTPNSIYKISPAGWIQITGAALSSTFADFRASFTVADNRAFFSINGADNIQEIDLDTDTYAALGNAPSYRFITSAFNRIIGANLRGTPDIPYQIGWSGDLNYAQWDPSSDISAGFTPLVDTPADESDDITGVLQVQSAICIVRQRSIWLGTNLPSATNPFYFFVAVPKIGSDCPYTIQSTGVGVTFYNYLRGAVYYFEPNPNGSQTPVEISGPIKRTLKSIVQNPNLLFASYDNDSNTYSLFYANANTGITTCFTYNFELKNWSHAEYPGISFAGTVDYSSSDISIVDLTGSISSLVGVINQLGGLVSNSNRFFGSDNGIITTQPAFYGSKIQVGNIIIADNGQLYSSIIDSKIFTNPAEDTYFNCIAVGYTPYFLGEITLSYSKDGGISFIPYKTVTITNQQLGRGQILRAKKPVKCREFMWRFSNNNSFFSIDSYRIWAEAGGVAIK